MKYKIFEANNKQTAVNNLLKEGYSVATYKQVVQLREKGEIPDKWYDLNMVNFYRKGILRKMTVAELKDLKGKVYDKNGRVLFVINGGSLSGGNSLNYNARFVGVKT